jgi:hypothetical protein
MDLSSSTILAGNGRHHDHDACSGTSDRGPMDERPQPLVFTLGLALANKIGERSSDRRPALPHSSAALSINPAASVQ